MKPEAWEGQNCVLGAPANWDEDERGKCGGLPVYRDYGKFISCWAPSWRERIRLLFGQRVWMTVVSNSHPPVSLHVFPRQKPERAT
jgi:hypothetical protein